MGLRQPRYPMEEFRRRGEEIYLRDIVPRLPAGSDGNFVAIDIESGEWETDSDDYAASEHLLSRIPDAQIWLVRVGQPTAYRMGGHRRAAP